MGARHKHSSGNGNKSNLLVVSGLFICIFILLWKDTHVHNSWHHSNFAPSLTQQQAAKQQNLKSKPQPKAKPLPFHKVSYLDHKPVGKADPGALLVSHEQQQQQQQQQQQLQQRRASRIGAAAAVTDNKKVLLQYALDYSKVFQDVYGPAGYHVCPALADGSTHLCWLQLRKDVNCRRLFSEYRTLLETHVPTFPAPRELPPAQRDTFLLRNYTQLSGMYFPQLPKQPNAAAPVWTHDTIAPYMNKTKARVPVGAHGQASMPVYQALECHPVKGQKGAVFGSGAPWLEGMLFALGSTDITTIDPRPVISHIPNHRALTPLQWVHALQSGQLAAVDYAYSFSSWEHEGLGRYGDALDPWGDVKAVQRASCYVRPGGLLYFAGPSSSIDQIMYNAHRIYGPVRYPLLTANWEVLGIYDARYKGAECGKGTCQGLFARWDAIAPARKFDFQPIVVMRNLRTTPCDLRADHSADQLHTRS